jgi:hypothetical protein
MRHNSCARRSALIAWSVRNISRNEDLLSGAHRNAALQLFTKIDGHGHAISLAAFADINLIPSGSGSCPVWYCDKKLAAQKTIVYSRELRPAIRVTLSKLGSADERFQCMFALLVGLKQAAE